MKFNIFLFTVTSLSWFACLLLIIMGRIYTLPTLSWRAGTTLGSSPAPAHCVLLSFCWVTGCLRALSTPPIGKEAWLSPSFFALKGRQVLHFSPLSCEIMLPTSGWLTPRSCFVNSFYISHGIGSWKSWSTLLAQDENPINICWLNLTHSGLD